ncbi:hypothetical protein [Caulobacter sp.]|uniref:hypothetical protein n=1 Tax=Caulobacter sp. TaxID=78 RepID=UPI003BAEC1D3
MSGFRPTKPRVPGTLQAALTRAIDQLHGLDHAAELIDRGRDWLYSAADPDREKGKQANLSYAEARTLSRHGATALAEDLALLAGGVFLPPVPATAPAAIHMALAQYAHESGEAISLMISRVADGVFDVPDAKAALKEIDEALRAMMALRALAASVLETGEAAR